ncbi:Asp-tRNA(Asn)/Glu-tRNA(Gln) amidotransferase subunit GatC [Candidatus Kaiserbacteria bacterium]|nr:Asp-tRNA(Asn)/Glu-tRNA(Gln) amidotransferase subunit GatC [Candidatus Kaiserbacteria bacterium]
MKREDIEHLATLARIDLKDEEVASLTDSITSILGYVSDVNAITTEEKPKEVGALYNVMREDEETHEPGQYTEAILNEAPKREGQYIQVKKILGDNE